MSKITTEDCKNFIKEHFSLTSTVSIKRDRKYKDGNGDVIRVFKFNDDDTCLIKEDGSGKLSIIIESDVVEKPKTTPKEFNAKSFIKKYIKKLENDDDDDTMDNFIKETAALSSENKVKVANEFYFYFPSETYHNETRSITNGLDTPMLIDGKYGKESLCIIFYDSLDSEPDLYISDILREILPDYFDKVDEYHFEIDTNEYTKKLSINGMIELLQHYGFTYKNSTEYMDVEGCILAKLNLK